MKMEGQRTEDGDRLSSAFVPLLPSVFGSRSSVVCPLSLSSALGPPSSVLWAFSFDHLISPCGLPTAC
jgi:hypothetical protein